MSVRDETAAPVGPEAAGSNKGNGSPPTNNGRSASWQALVDRARARDIASAAPEGLKREGHQLVGPCPSCQGRRRFFVDTRKQYFGCSGCGAGGDVIALVMFLDGCDFKAAVEMLAGDTVPVRATPPPVEHGDNGHVASTLWSRRQPIAGTAGELYLREVRKIGCPIPPTLGFLPAWKEHHPAIIAAVTFADEAAPGILSAPRNVDVIHLTRLKADGSGKAEVDAAKGYLARPWDRPIVIAPPNDLLGMAITEGIEDGLSAHEATGLGVWAAGTANRLPKIAARVPWWVECVTIFGHDDIVGRRHALEAADILHGRGIEVRIEGFEP